MLPSVASVAIVRMSQKREGKKGKGKKGKKAKKKAEEAVPQDLTSEDAKRDMISALLAKTDLGEDTLEEAYDKFYSNYPGGEITEQQFLKISTVKIESRRIDNNIYSSDKS